MSEVLMHVSFIRFIHSLYSINLNLWKISKWLVWSLN